MSEYQHGFDEESIPLYDRSLDGVRKRIGCDESWIKVHGKIRYKVREAGMNSESALEVTEPVYSIDSLIDKGGVLLDIGAGTLKAAAATEIAQLNPKLKVIAIDKS